MPAAEVSIVDRRVILRDGKGIVLEAPLPRVLDELSRSGDRQPSCSIVPVGVRRWIDRRDLVAVAVELPPQARMVRWLADGSRVQFGRRAAYKRYFLSFPYVELLLVFRGGALTGYQQLYYRTASIDQGEDLLLPNLYNVAEGYGQRCWLCLVNLGDLTELSWPAKINAVVEHVFGAAFNQSSEVHEGNSYWGAMRDLDRRLASPEAWQEATRANPRFTLDVAWRPAQTTVIAELEAMLGHIEAPVRVETAADLGNILNRAARREGRR
jgi:hypothetical protein